MSEDEDLETVSTERKFNQLEIELLIESLRLMESVGRRMAISISDSNGNIYSREELPAFREPEEFLAKLMSGEMRLEATSNGPELNEEEKATIDNLIEFYIGGLGVLDRKFEKMVTKKAEEGIKDVMAGITEMLKKEGNS